MLKIKWISVLVDGELDVAYCRNKSTELSVGPLPKDMFS